MPAFAPLLKPPEIEWWFVVDVWEGGGVLVEAIVLDVVTVNVDELDVEVVDGAALRTRNLGLDNSLAFGPYVEDAALNRKTYFALTAKYSSGIAMVHA
jgi:hypothetical protein